jgi:MFS family permease
MGLTSDQRTEQPSAVGMGALPHMVIALGFVSLATDTSSEIIHGLLPAFLVTVLGASALSVGFIEGVAEATVSIAKVFSGAISDWIGKRKLLVVLGYGLAALTKPLFPLAHGIGLVLAARFLDRLGKGIRGAPRDPLIADVTPIALRGTAFGLRQSMDTVGAFLGPLLAIGLMAATADNFRFVLWIAAIPAAIAVLLLIYGVQEPASLSPPERQRFPIRGAELSRLSADFVWLVAIASVLTLARFSEAFLLLAGQSTGMAVTLVPGILVVMNVVYAATSFPFGRLADRMSRGMLLVIGTSVLILADIVLATASTVWQVAIGAAIWGLHMGATQGVLSALVADAVPKDLRGTAFGLYGLITGGALFAASLIAGWLWTAFGPSATFTAGAAFAGMALIAIAVRWPRAQTN